MEIELTDDAEILFRRIKDVALRSPRQSARFKEWLMSQTPSGMEFHHAMGSVHGLKSSGYLAVAVTKAEHRTGQRNREWTIRQLPRAIENLLRYVEHLENEKCA